MFKLLHAQYSHAHCPAASARHFLGAGRARLAQWDKACSPSPCPPPRGWHGRQLRRRERGRHEQARRCCSATKPSNSTGTASAGQGRALPFHARAAGATGAVHLYVDSANTATTLLVGLYANRWHRPGALLSTGSALLPAARRVGHGAAGVDQLVSGATYWLAVLGTGGTLRFRDHTHGPCASLASAQTNLETPAATWSTGSSNGPCPVSAYATAATPFPVEPPAPVELVPPPAPPGKSTSPPVETTPPVAQNPPPPVETTPPPVETSPPPVETSTSTRRNASATGRNDTSTRRNASAATAGPHQQRAAHDLRAGR